jgi:hypothetical protein
MLSNCLIELLTTLSSPADFSSMDDVISSDTAA